jgi:hypothetical protein
MLTDRFRDVLMAINKCQAPNSLPWAEDGTDAGKAAKQLAALGLCVQVGKSMTGSYWSMTPAGIIELGGGLLGVVRG